MIHCAADSTWLYVLATAVTEVTAVTEEIRPQSFFSTQMLFSVCVFQICHHLFNHPKQLQLAAESHFIVCHVV